MKIAIRRRSLASPTDSIGLFTACQPATPPDITFTSVGSRQKRLFDMGDDTFAEVSLLPILMPITWTPATAFNARVYPDIEIQVIGTPTTSYVFQDSFDGITFNDCSAWDRNGLALPAITAAGCGLDHLDPGGNVTDALTAPQHFPCRGHPKRG